MSEAEERFRGIFHTAYPALCRYAHHRGLGESDADDLVADTLEIAWRRLRDVPPDDPLPWLYGVARNLLRNRVRSERRRKDLVTRLCTVLERQDESHPREISAEALRAALSTLREDDQELLRLVAWDDLNPTQAAAVLGCTPAAARTRLHRARNRLARRLGVNRRRRPRSSGQLRVQDVPHSHGGF